MSENNTLGNKRNQVDSESNYASNRGSDNPMAAAGGRSEKQHTEKGITAAQARKQAEMDKLNAPNKESYCKLSSANINAPE
jgi:hypothetical protein